MSIKLSLSYDGENADEHEIDFYDVAQGLIGFQRTLAITTHLLVNGEVITQAPALKGAQILALPAKEGSWEIAAMIVAGAFAVGSLSKDSIIGYYVHSALDYVVSNALGFDIDYSQTIGQQYKKIKAQGIDLPMLEQSKFDSVIEKCEIGLREIHRPIYAKKTARSARISCLIDREPKLITAIFNEETYEYIHDTIQDGELLDFEGRVSSYNSNTYKGRIFEFEEERPIAFELASNARNSRNQKILAKSLFDNVNSGFKAGDITVSGYKLLSKNGRLKGILITHID